MKEHGIIFNAEMVRAILDGRKTQTRIIMKPQPVPINGGDNHVWYCEKIDASLDVKDALQDGNVGWYGLISSVCPLGGVGDRLYVREKFSRLESFGFFDSAVPYETPDFWYWADGEPEWGNWTRPQSGAVMPRNASRISLEVTGVRVERLRDADDMTLLDELGDMLDDCHSVAGRAFNHAEHYDIAGIDVGMMPEMHGFKAWWDKVNGSGSFDSNPWVWVIEFKQIQG
ncbi:hypothetical protein [Morganella morganii]|uniref:hypothetical protein n=1 Tax=Morganella morganii TaxID=582 RepID=UPI001C75DF97|nr:hypothetical protein [Morganella morganii]MBT0521282.1 hypothetical protein [Morganella morganii subsp. morganii]QWL88190.1 hypothetical protein IZ187_11355 [Morganella morganii subsp. morganii]QWL90468.1 hypothetical protein IZ187_04530 [Morganella morganii subsp. morganii]